MLRPIHALPLLVTCLLVIGCRKLSPLESKLVGTWSVPQVSVAEDGSTPTGAANTTLRNDHIFWQSPSGAARPVATSVLSGQWRVDGDQLILHCTRASPGYLGMVGQDLRFIVTEFETNKFVAVNAENQNARLVWTRVR